MIMRKTVVVVEHKGGYFLADEGNFSKRLAPMDNSYGQHDVFKQFPTVEKYYKFCKKTFSTYIYDKVIISTDDLTDNNSVVVEDRLDQLGIDQYGNIYDIETAELIKAKEETQPEIKEENKMKTTETTTMKKNAPSLEDIKAKRSESARKGHETRRKNAEAKRQAELEAKAEEQFEEAHKEEVKEPEKPQQPPSPPGIEKETVEEPQQPEPAPTMAGPQSEEEAAILQDIEDNELRIEVENSILDQAAKIMEQRNINNQNQDDMKQSEEKVHVAEPIKNSEATQEQQPKASTLRRVRRGLAKGTEFGVVTGTDVAITTLVATSDLIYLLAEGLAYGQAAAVKPLGLHPDATISELKEEAMHRADRRTNRIYSVPKAIIDTPKQINHAVKMMKTMGGANNTQPA